MKCLVTGFTALQVNTNRRPIQKLDGPAAVCRALQERGHEVDWRLVKVGEDLSAYDLAWVNLAPLNSLNGRKGAIGALWTLAHQMPLVCFADDWQVAAVFNGARSLVRKPQNLYKKLGEQGRYYMSETDESTRPYESQLIAAAESMSISYSLWSRVVPVCPMYRWGNRHLVKKRMPKTIAPIEALDLSPLVYSTLAEHPPLPPDEKKREWLLAALMPHTEWADEQRVTWPLEFIGSKKVVRERGGTRFKTESEVLGRYNQSWGIMSPPYPHAGSGWWRSRFIYAASVRSVLVCDKGEGDPLGPAHRVKIAQVEGMTTGELADLAEAQAAELRPWMTTWDDFVEHCDRIVHRAVAGG